MKPKYQSPSRLLACLIVLAGTQLHAANLTWDGQGGDASWLTGANWVGNPATVTMGIDSIQTFNTGGALNLTNYFGDNTTIGKLHFNANAGTNVSTTLADLPIGGAASNLTFDVTTDNATILTDAGSTGNFTLGVSDGSIVLNDHLAIIHNGTDWEYRTFSLHASEGLAGRGFLRIQIND